MSSLLAQTACGTTFQSMRSWPCFRRMQTKLGRCALSAGRVWCCLFVWHVNHAGRPPHALKHGLKP